jgi:hypothetical protein
LPNFFKIGDQMAFDKLNLKNPTTGEIKQAPVGFSWTTLFFGFFVPIFRSDWLMAVILLGLAFVTAGLSNIIFAFIYNKIHIKNLLYKEGFKVTGSVSGDYQKITNKLGIELPMIE